MNTITKNPVTLKRQDDNDYIEVRFVGEDTLNISFRDNRLVALTVFNGKPDICIHYMNKAELQSLKETIESKIMELS